MVDIDLPSHEGQRLGGRVSVRFAIGVVDDGLVGYDLFLTVLTDRGRLEVDPPCPFGVEYYALDVGSLDRLELGGLVMACRLIVVARTCLAARGERYYAGGDQHETRAGGPQPPPALEAYTQPAHSPRLSPAAPS